METWTADFIDDVLRKGNDIYGESVERLKRVNRYCHPYLAQYELACVTVVRGLHRITFRVDDDNCFNSTLFQSLTLTQCRMN